MKRKGGGDRAEIWANGDNRSAQVSSCLGDNREIPAVISVGWFRKPSVAALCEASLPTIRRTCPPVINFTGLSQVDRWMPISLSSSSSLSLSFFFPLLFSFRFISMDLSGRSTRCQITRALRSTFLIRRHLTPFFFYHHYTALSPIVAFFLFRFSRVFIIEKYLFFFLLSLFNKFRMEGEILLSLIEDGRATF